MKAKDIMTKDPICLKETDSIKHAAEQFREEKIDGAPVIDNTGKLTGIFTKGHLMDAIIKGINNNVAISSLMTKDVLTVKADTSVQDIWNIKIGRVPIVDDRGNILGIITRTDLVDAFIRKSDQSNDMLKKILESAYNAIIVVNKEGEILHWNSAAEKLTGISKEKAIGGYVTDSIPNTGLLETLKTGKGNYGQKLHLGSTTAVTNRSPIIMNGEVIGAIAVFQDISDLENIAQELKASKQLNKELDAIINSVYDGLYITDGQGFTTGINKSYTRITGIKMEEVLGRHMEELVECGMYSQSVTLIVLEKKQPVTIMHTIKGHKRCLITGNPIFDEKGEIIQVVTTVRDITELINLKEKLEQSQELTRKYHLELEHLRKQQMQKTNIIGRSKNMLQVLDLADRAALVDATVLILGETGVGKEVIAKEIHKNSPRSKESFIKINCAAIPENLLESELFGYEKGAFTGAERKGKPGLFELADSGTIFLDEIGDFPMNLQPKLLRVLQEKEITRIGGTKPKELNVRIIAATNKNLEKLVKDGEFREDLFYRLNVIPINIPPLRFRSDDIALFADYFLRKFNKKYNKDKELGISVIEALNRHSWPGNVRELENLLERLIVIVNDKVITEEHLKGLLEEKTSNNYLHFINEENISLEKALAMLEKQIIEKILKEQGSTRKAAKKLGISQASVVRKAKKYKIH